MTDKEKKPLMKKRDAIIILAVLVIAAAGMLAVRYFSPSLSPDQETHTARILVGSYVYKEVSLDEDQIVEINQGNDVINHVEIKDGAIYMQDSTCPDQQCVYQGEITAENYEDRPLRNWIVCLPNQVTVELVLEDEG